MWSANSPRCWFSLLLVSAAARIAHAQVFNCVGGSVYIMAHADDDLLFASPDLVKDVQSKACITSIFLTAGDSGTNLDYSRSREHGNEAAYAKMLGVADHYTDFSAIFGGQPVLVRTLKAAPQIQKIWFRLPDGDMDGSGFDSTSYESIRSLYFGQIGSIRNVDRTATYSMGTLKQALGEILTARKPSRIRTLDHLSQFDAGDHSDHIATGRISREVASSYAGGAAFTGYMGYPVSNLPPTMATTSSDFKLKEAAFFAYTPYDSMECTSFSNCRDAGRGEASWLQRQYAVNPDLATTSTIGAGGSPIVLPSGTNVARSSGVVATASSTESSLTPASAAIDGVISGYPAYENAEWASKAGKVGSWLKLTWSTPQIVSSIVLYDRPNREDWLMAGTFTFSNGVKVAFSNPTNDGSPAVIPLSTPITTTSLLVTVTQVSASTSNVGISELQVYGAATSTRTSSTSIRTSSTSSRASSISTRPTTSSAPPASFPAGPAPSATGNLALLATVTASSGSSGQGAEKAIDGASGPFAGYRYDGQGDFSKEWASDHQGAGATLTLRWASPVTLSRVVLFDRVNQNDQILAGRVDFAGSSFTVGALPNTDGSSTTVTFPSRLTGSVLVFTVIQTASTTENVGLSEIQAWP